MNDWTCEKSQEYMERAKAIGQDIMNETKALGIKIRFTTTEDDQKAILNRLGYLKQEAIVLKKISERILGANLEYMIEHMGEES